MFAEEDALEPRRFGACPRVEIAVEMALRHRGIEMLCQFRRRCKEFEDPRLDHFPAPAGVSFSQNGPLKRSEDSQGQMTMEILGHLCTDSLRRERRVIPAALGR